MKYNPILGVFGNITRLYTERNKTNNQVSNNKATQDAINANSEDVMCEIDNAQNNSDYEDALVELDERLLALESQMKK